MLLIKSGLKLLLRLELWLLLLEGSRLLLLPWRGSRQSVSILGKEFLLGPDLILNRVLKVIGLLKLLLLLGNELLLLLLRAELLLRRKIKLRLLLVELLLKLLRLLLVKLLLSRSKLLLRIELRLSLWGIKLLLSVSITKKLLKLQEALVWN